MLSDSFRFKVGDIDGMAVSDGASAPESSALASSARAAHGRDATSTKLHWLTQRSPTRTCLVLRTGRHTLLIEAGAGERAQPRGRLLDNLRAAGVTPEEIDTVILSHAHPGHMGGTVDRAGKLAFPNARYVVWREEWEFWMSRPDLTARRQQWVARAAHGSLLAVHHQLELIEREALIVPGVQAIAAPGHSAGHMALAIASQGEHLLYLADAVLHPAHLEHPHWCSPMDLRPEQSVTSRLRLLDRAVASGALAHAFHFPFPGLGHVIQHGDAWRWQPLVAEPA